MSTFLGPTDHTGVNATSSAPPPGPLFPCTTCYGASSDYYCRDCKGSGKSDRQLLLDLLGAVMLVVDLLQRKEPPAPAPTRTRDSRLDIIGPGLRQKPTPSFPTLTDADRLAIHKGMVEQRKKRNKK